MGGMKNMKSGIKKLSSYLVIDEKGMFEGAVSGGCIEGAVVAEALEVISDGKSRRVFFASPKTRRGKWGWPAAVKSRFLWKK